MPATGNSETYAWARHRSRGELFDLVLEIEGRLRRLVRSVLQEHTKPPSGWEDLIPASIRSQIAPATRGERDLLHRANLGQLFGVVLNGWSLFQELCGGDKSAFHESTEEFRLWRNALAHGTTPSDDDKVVIAAVVTQVGRHVPATAESLHLPGESVHGAALLWVDDRPENNLRERQIFRMLGIEVIPAIGNHEAIELARHQRFDLVISDIDRRGAERGDMLPARLRAVGVDTPIVFYVGKVAPGVDIPAGAADIFDDPALLVLGTLTILTRAR